MNLASLASVASMILGMAGSLDLAGEVAGGEVAGPVLDRQRLDLQAARAQVAAAERALALKVGTRFLPAGISLGVNTEREPEGEQITGPTLDLELPIFNQGQGEIATLRARDLQARRQLEAKLVDAHAEVRVARAQVAANRALAVSLRDTVLPQRQQALRLTLEQYNSMLKGAYDLLTAKANEAAAERTYLEAWRDYWIARADLERAVGGKALTLTTRR